jgi:tetratricopeptide (TPR) repeat protein
MILPQSNAIDLPTRIAAEGHAALGLGDTDRARACYLEAGKLIEASIANERKQSEKHLLRFLAASQYYHGGHYEKALALGRRIEARFLSGNARSLFPQFMKDATTRAKPDYVLTTRQTVARLWQRAEYQVVIEMFQQHPYILPAHELAAIRALCCEKLKEYHAAALFFGDAWRMDSQSAEATFLTVSYVFLLVAESKLTEAHEYLNRLVKEVPHALTFAILAILRYFEASAASAAEERKKLSEEQIHYFDKALALYQALPTSHRNHPAFRYILTIAAESAALGLMRLDQQERALEVCAWAADLSPDLPGPKKVREVIASHAPIEGTANEFVKVQTDWITKARAAAVGDLLPTAA